MNFWWIWTQNLVPMSYITYFLYLSSVGRIWKFFLWLIWIMAKIDIFETFVLLYGNLRIFPSLRNLRQGQNPLPKMGLTRIHCPKWVWPESTAQNGSYYLISVLGATTIRLEMPGHMQNSLIFHYNLKFYGKDTDNYEGISLKRFVMQVSDQFDEKLCKFWYYKGDQNCTLFPAMFFSNFMWNQFWLILRTTKNAFLAVWKAVQMS